MLQAVFVITYNVMVCVIKLAKSQITLKLHNRNVC